MEDPRYIASVDFTVKIVGNTTHSVDDLRLELRGVMIAATTGHPWTSSKRIQAKSVRVSRPELTSGYQPIVSFVITVQLKAEITPRQIRAHQKWAIAVAQAFMKLMESSESCRAPAHASAWATVSLTNQFRVHSPAPRG